MDYIVACLVALLVSALTLFSGFGLGTVLMPAFALFFPVPVAIAATAVVHLANNLFKVSLVGRKANWLVVVKFALPGAAAAIVDVARLLVYGFSFYATKFAGIAPGMGGLILAATLAAFVGSFIGTRLLKKVTLRTIQIIVGVMLVFVGAGMASGLF